MGASERKRQRCVGTTGRKVAQYSSGDRCAIADSSSRARGTSPLSTSLLSPRDFSRGPRATFRAAVGETPSSCWDELLARLCGKRAREILTFVVARGRRRLLENDDPIPFVIIKCARNNCVRTPGLNFSFFAQAI